MFITSLGVSFDSILAQSISKHRAFYTSSRTFITLRRVIGTPLSQPSDYSCQHGIAFTLFYFSPDSSSFTILTFLTPPFHRAKAFHGDFVRAFRRKTIIALFVVYPLTTDSITRLLATAHFSLLGSMVPSCLMIQCPFVM